MKIKSFLPILLCAAAFLLPAFSAPTVHAEDPAVDPEEIAAAEYEAEEMLYAMGFPCTVLATDYDYDPTTSISLVQSAADDSYWMVYSNHDVLFGTQLTEELYDFCENPYDPVVFTGCFFGDTHHESDDSLGIWDGDDHYLTVYGSYEIVNGRAVKSDYSSSARGTLDASHYDARIAWLPHENAIDDFFYALPDLHFAVERKGLDITAF